MPPEPLVSVVIPARDGERHLGEAIESVLAQTRRDLEVVVVDDGSTDGTAAVADSFGAPVRCLRRAAPAGPGAARNLGVRHARGRFVAFLDHDDLWAADKLERQLAAFAAGPDVDLVFGHVREFLSPDLDPVLAARLAHVPEPRPAVQSGALLARAGTVRRVGPFGTTRQASEFLEWLLRAEELGLRKAIVPETVLWRRLHGRNHNVVNPAAPRDYAYALKASLDRRRARSRG